MVRTQPARWRRRFTEREIALAALRGSPCHRVRQKKKRVFKPRKDPFVEFPHEPDFTARFRLPPWCVKEISEEFARSPFCTTRGDPRGGGIQIHEKVCLALRYLATGANYQVLRDSQGVKSVSTVSRCVNEFIGYLNAIMHNHIRFPKDADIHVHTQKFYKRFGIRNCVAAIDGTYVPILKPIAQEGAFITRHHFHGLNVLAAFNADLRIVYINATFPGSFHDTHCWETSNLHEACALNNRLQGNHLIGDNGYPLSPWLMIPFSPTQLREATRAQRSWNKQFIKARLVAERGLARVKGCWRSISKQGSGVVKRQPLQCMQLVNATAVLHNISIDAGCSAYSAINNPDPDFEPQLRRQAVRRFARARAIVNPNVIPPRVPLTQTDRLAAGRRRRSELIYSSHGGPRPTHLHPLQLRRIQRQ